MSIPGLSDQRPRNNNISSTPNYLKLLSSFSDMPLENNTFNSNFDTYTVKNQQVTSLDMASRNQSVSTLWYQYRMGRVTAAISHSTLTL